MNEGLDIIGIFAKNCTVLYSKVPANPSIHLANITILMWYQAMLETSIKWKYVTLTDGKKAIVSSISQAMNARDSVYGVIV